MLHEAGHEVVCVENGLDLIAAVSDQAAGRSSDSPRFDIVLTDVQMPLMDGIAATREVRRIERDTNSGSHVPIVAVTAHAMADEKDRMRQSGVDDIVTKPILPSELSRVLQHLTGVGVVEGGVKPSPESAVSPGRVVANSEPVPQATSCENTPTGSSELDSLCQLVGEVVQEVASVESFGAEAQTVGATPFDVADVFMRSGDSARRSKLIFKAFARSFSEPLQALSTGGEEKEVGKVKEAAHALKGLLLDIGAKDVGGLAADIEDACKRGEGECAFQKVPQLSREVSFVGAVTERLMQRFEQVVSSVKTPEAATGKVTEVVERSENIVNAVLDRDRLAATPVRLLSCAEAAMKDVLGQLSDSDLYDLIPPSLVNPEGVHPSVDLVYQLLDVHDVLQREGNSTNRSLIVFGAFLHGYEELLRELETSSSEKDITRIRETAHSLKTVLRETGCPLGADVAGQIESLCAAGEVDDALGMCESLKRQTRLVGKVVRRIVDESAPS
jgi:CheY-like chemotaxis protein